MFTLKETFVCNNRKLIKTYFSPFHLEKKRHHHHHHKNGSSRNGEFRDNSTGRRDHHRHSGGHY